MDDIILANRNKFLEIARSIIKRDGIDNLLDYLEKGDFFTAPASAKFHCDYEGGLLEHSLNVYNRLRQNILNEYGDFNTYSEESIAICGLLHDLCKVDYYKVEMRNVKEKGEWVQKPYYVVDEKLPYGHGEKSVYIINGFIRLTREEAIAINWHMGGFDHRVQGGNGTSVGESYKKFPLALWLHLSDMQATYLDENSLLKKN
ncbi:MAG: hydrolase [Christensenellales bacterium]